MTTITLTSEEIKRVTDSIKETQNSLNKELAYSEDLRNATRVEFLQNHIAKLQTMIANG